MKCLDLTLATPEQNLAADEALLEGCETGRTGEVLRFWEPRDYFVVLGYANKIATEVQTTSCETRGVPIRRRCSGGGTVLQGPGCLNYSLVLSIDPAGPTAGISGTNAFVMQRQRQALQSLLSSPVHVEGVTDLALGSLKFSGNAQKRRRNSLLFHGTFLLSFNLPLIEQLLAPPAREPAYRHGRPHREFLTNLRLPAGVVKAALQAAWGATKPMEWNLDEDIGRLVTAKYSTAAWNLKF